MNFEIEVWKDIFGSGFLAMDTNDPRATVHTGRTPRHAIAKVLHHTAKVLETE